MQTVMEEAGTLVQKGLWKGVLRGVCAGVNRAFFAMIVYLNYLLSFAHFHAKVQSCVNYLNYHVFIVLYMWLTWQQWSKCTKKTTCICRKMFSLKLRLCSDCLWYICCKCDLKSKFGIRFIRSWQTWQLFMVFNPTVNHERATVCVYYAF